MRHLINAQVRLAYGETTTRHKRIADVSDSLIFLLYFCARRRDEELINLMQLLLMKVPLAAPCRTRNAPSVENERKVIMGAWKQARHSILPNSFHGPGSRLQVLQRLAAHILIDHLPGSSLAANSSRLRFCRRAPFFFIPTSLASPLGPPPMEPLFPIGHCLFNLLVRQFPGGSTKVLGWCPHDGYLVCRDRSSGSLECGSNYCATESELRIARMGNECRKVFCWRSFSLGEATVGAGL